MAKGIVISGDCSDITVENNKFVGMDTDIEVEKGGRLSRAVFRNNVSIARASIDEETAKLVIALAKKQQLPLSNLAGPKLENALRREPSGRAILDKALERGANLATILGLVASAFR